MPTTELFLFSPFVKEKYSDKKILYDISNNFKNNDLKNRADNVVAKIKPPNF